MHRKSEEQWQMLTTAYLEEFPEKAASNAKKTWNQLFQDTHKMVTPCELILQTITKPSDNFPTIFKETEFSTWGETVPQARACCVPALTLVTPHPPVSITTPLAPQKGRTGQTLCSSQVAYVSWRALDGAGKGPKLRLGGEPMKAGGAGPGMPRRSLWLPQKPCLSMGRHSLFLLQPLSGGSAQGSPIQNRHMRLL